jgi:hypothetical protein
VEEEEEEGGRRGGEVVSGSFEATATKKRRAHLCFPKFHRKSGTHFARVRTCDLFQ